MWSFSYQGPGMKSMARAGEPSPSLQTAMDTITAEAEKQMVDKPEAVIPHIRAAAAAVKELVRASDEVVSIVAEGWVEQDGQASTTINVAVSPAVAETKR